MLHIKQYQKKWIYILSIAFVIVNTVLIYKEFYWFSLFPLALVIVLMAFFSLDKLLLALVFLTPLSVNLKDIGLGVGLTLPTEPIMFGIMILFIIRFILEGGINKKILKHPLTILIAIHLLWLFVTTLTSSDIVVSIKFFVSRLWFVICFYFLGIELFKKQSNIRRYFWLYIASLLLVIIYTITIHAQYGFEEKPGHWVMSPFFNDHTSYGAMIAFFMPFIIGYTLNKHLPKKQIRYLAFFILSIFSIAIILSYTRAAWVSLIGAFGIYFIYHFKIKWYFVLIIGLIGLGGFFTFKTQLLMKLEKNRQSSSSDISEHVQSISNISTDASNLERINRWNCAIRMFKERPVLGWGPGTYSFVYAPFQLASEKTIISTNAGDRGNAHSEYLGPLSESGVFGMLSFILIILATYFYSSKIYKQAKNKEIQILALIIITSLTTYYIHGVLNNFLDTDKASVPFWGLIAMLTALDLYYIKQKQEKEHETI